MATKNYTYRTNGTSALKYDIDAHDETPIIQFEAYAQQPEPVRRRNTISQDEYSLFNTTIDSINSSVKDLFKTSAKVNRREGLVCTAIVAGTFALLVVGVMLGF